MQERKVVPREIGYGTAQALLHIGLARRDPDAPLHTLLVPSHLSDDALKDMAATSLRLLAVESIDTCG